MRSSYLIWWAEFAWFYLGRICRLFWKLFFSFSVSAVVLKYHVSVFFIFLSKPTCLIIEPFFYPLSFSPDRVCQISLRRPKCKVLFMWVFSVIWFYLDHICFSIWNHFPNPCCKICTNFHLLYTCRHYTTKKNPWQVKRNFVWGK